MITLDLPTDLERRLAEASKESGESLSDIAQSLFREWLEDFEDVREAERRLDAGEGEPQNRLSMDEVKRNLGLEG